MKKSIILLTFLLMFIGKSNAQNWNLNGNVLGTPPPPYIVGGLSGAYDIFFYANGNQYMDLQYSTGALGIGLSYAPSYQLDVQCTPSLPSLKDINISANTGPQNVGYRIGGQYVLWHNGITSNIFVGVSAGNANTGVYENTFVGGNAGNANQGDYNTAIGYRAGYANITGSGNTFVGTGATANASGYSNSTALGAGTTITDSNQMNISGNGHITSFVIPNTTGSKPVNTATPVAWEKVVIGGTLYYIPLYQ